MLAHVGYKTLMVDADASTNGLTLLCLPQVLAMKKLNPESRGMFDPRELGTLVPCEIESNVALIPATYSMRNTENVALSTFEDALTSVRNLPEWDFVLLDAQAGIDPFAKATAAIADQVIIVSEYDPISVQGIERLKVIFADTMASANVWVLFNKILPEFAKAIGEGLLIARYLPPIAWDADVVRAFALRQPVLNLAKPNVYCITIINILRVLFPDSVSDRLDQWVKEHEQAIQQPLVDHLKEIESNMRDLESDKISIDLSLRNIQIINNTGIILTFAAIFAIVAGAWSFLESWLLILFVVAIGGLLAFMALGFLVTAQEAREKRKREKRLAIERMLEEKAEEKRKYKAAIDSSELLDRSAIKR
jgi:MinD-like ATPase involved in chromosome partitioning or flagellar assembly